MAPPVDSVDVASSSGGDEVVFDPVAELESLLDALAPGVHRAGLDLVGQVARCIPPRLSGECASWRQIVALLVEHAVARTERGEIVVRLARAPLVVGPSSFKADWEPDAMGRLEVGGRIEVDIEVHSRAGRETIPSGAQAIETARGFLEASGGRLYVRREDQSSVLTFRVAFSATEASAEKLIVPDTVHDSRILVADDGPTLRMVLGETLQSWGVRTTIVDSGEAALTVIRDAHAAEKPFDAVLLDARMPRMSGFELAEYLVKNPGLTGPVLLLLPVPSRQGDDAYCRRLGVSVRVAKPIRRTELLQALSTALVGRKLTQYTGASELTLPIVPSERLRRESGDAAHPSGPHGRRLLLADENPARQRHLARLLEAHGHHTTMVSTPHEALAQLPKGAFDVVLFNVDTPERSGLEAVARLRMGESGGRRHLPAVALTDLSRVEDRAAWLHAGFDAVVTRPIEPRELIAAIENLLHPPARPASEQAVYDEAAALARVDGDASLLQAFVAIFRDGAPRLLTSCREALLGRDGKRLVRASSELRSSVALLAAVPILDLLDRLRDLAERGQIDAASHVFDDLHDALTQLRDVLSKVPDSVEAL